MTDVKPELQDLLDKYFAETGTGKVILMAHIRDYVKRQSIYTLLDEIDRIQHEQELDVLLGAGMKGVLYYKVIGKKAKMVGL